MGGFAFTNLRAGLMMIVVLAVLPPLGLAIYTNLEQRRLGVEEVSADTLRVTRLAAANQEQLIEGTRQLLIALADLPAVNDFDSALCGRLFGRLLKSYPHYSSLGAVDAEGTPRCASLPLPGSINASDRAWFQRAVHSRDFSVGDFEIGRVSSKPTIHLSYPITDRAGNLKGVVFAGVDLQEIDPFTADTELVHGATVFMMDSQGTILARFPEAEKWIGKPMPEKSVAQAILAKGEGLVEARDEEGIERLYAFAPVHKHFKTGLFMGIGTPIEVGYARAERILFRNLTGLGLACLLALGAAWFVGDRFILGRVAELLCATQKLASGDLSARSGIYHDWDELSRLARAFNEMAASLEVRTRELRDAEARYRSLVEQIPAVTYSAVLDKVARAVYVSPQIEGLLGFTPQEWLEDREMWCKRLHPEDLDRVMLEVDTIGRSPGKTELALEYRLLARDGRVVWISDTGMVEKQEGDKPPLVQGVMFDITERRVSEEKVRLYQEQLRALASELALAEERERRRIAVDLHDLIAQKLALSKIKLETIGGAASAAGFADQVEQIHQFLEQAIQDTRSLINKISSPILYELGFEAAVEWAVEEFQRLHGVACVCESDEQPKPLRDDVRVVLFQAVNELLVNVAKHARASQCKVSLWREGGFVKIEIEDNGTGFDVEKNSPHRNRAGGFGLFSIRERLTLLGGSLDIDSEPGRGARMRLSAPLEAD